MKMAELSYTICEEAERAARAQWRTGATSRNPYKTDSMEAKLFDKEFDSVIEDLEWHAEQELNMNEWDGRG